MAKKALITIGFLFGALVLMLCIVVLIACLTPWDYPIETNRIEDYASLYEKWLPEDVFVRELPDDAQVVAFSYYNYWNEDVDAYLELTFPTEEAVHAYLATLEENLQHEQNEQSVFEPLYVEKELPTSRSYTHWLTNYAVTSSEGKRYAGYLIDSENQKIYSHCAIISFSFEERTVIQTYSNTWCSTVSEHIPTFLTRFSVPLNESSEFRHYYD